MYRWERRLVCPQGNIVPSAVSAGSARAENAPIGWGGTPRLTPTSCSSRVTDLSHARKPKIGDRTLAYAWKGAAGNHLAYGETAISATASLGRLSGPLRIVAFPFAPLYW